MPNANTNQRHAEIVTADAALMEVCKWIERMHAETERAVGGLSDAQAIHATINGRDYMGYAELMPLRKLRGFMRGSSPYAKARAVYDAVKADRWIEIDGDERGGILLSSEGVDDGE